MGEQFTLGDLCTRLRRHHKTLKFSSLDPLLKRAMLDQVQTRTEQRNGFTVTLVKLTGSGDAARKLAILRQQARAVEGGVQVVAPSEGLLASLPGPIGRKQPPKGADEVSEASYFTQRWLPACLG